MPPLAEARFACHVCCTQFEWWEGVRRAGLSGRAYASLGLQHTDAADITFDCLRESAWELAPMPSEPPAAAVAAAAATAAAATAAAALYLPPMLVASSCPAQMMAEMLRTHPQLRSADSRRLHFIPAALSKICGLPLLQAAALLQPQCAGSPATSTAWS
jgi:hypothetical protein